MEVGSSQEVSELGTVVGMVLPCDFQFCIHGNLEIYFREKKKEVVGLWQVMDIKKKVGMS